MYVGSIFYSSCIFLEIPVFPTVTAKVTFQEFTWRNDFVIQRFKVPRDYSEDPYRFPDL